MTPAAAARAAPAGTMMVVYCGLDCDTAVATVVEVLPCGAGRIVCLECGGTGDWTRFHPERARLAAPIICPDCKGSARR